MIEKRKKISTKSTTFVKPKVVHRLFESVFIMIYIHQAPHLIIALNP